MSYGGASSCPLQIGWTRLSFGSDPLSIALDPTPFYLPFGTLAAGNAPQSYGLEPAQNMNSRSTPRKTTAKARVLGHPPPLRAQRSRAKLGVIRSVNYGNGCRLDLVDQGENAALLGDYDEVALPGHTFTQKASVLFDFKSYQPFNHQFNVLLGKKQPTKRRLAKVAVKAVERFIRDCAGRGQPFPYKLEHLMLRSIEVVSRSSIRPVFELVTPPSA
ncbi:hypothetical protein V8D89_002609 [Ganoderma adspersum]